MTGNSDREIDLIGDFQDEMEQMSLKHRVFFIRLNSGEKIDQY